jgi:hypothetical protein
MARSFATSVFTPFHKICTILRKIVQHFLIGLSSVMFDKWWYIFNILGKSWLNFKHMLNFQSRYVKTIWILVVFVKLIQGHNIQKVSQPFSKISGKYYFNFISFLGQKCSVERDWPPQSIFIWKRNKNEKKICLKNLKNFVAKNIDTKICKIFFFLFLNTTQCHLGQSKGPFLIQFIYSKHLECQQKTK